MKYKIIERSNYIIISLTTNKLNGLIAPSLKSTFIILTSQGLHNIIFDCFNIDTFDSSGLSALLVGNRSCKSNNGKFIIVDDLSGRFSKLIKTRQLDTILKIYPSISEAEINEFNNQTEDDNELIGLTLINGKIRCVSLSTDGKYKVIDSFNNVHNIIYEYSAQIGMYKSVIEEFEYLINNEKTKEIDLQDFFERNNNFILNNEYKKAHSKIVLNKEDDKTLIPDFVLEPLNTSSLSDLLELKLPNAKLYNLKNNRPRYSSAILEACAQLREYAFFFDEERNRKMIKDKYGLLLYKPKMIVIIGRRKQMDPIQVRRIQSDLPGLTLKTYDDILDMMVNKLKPF